MKKLCLLFFALLFIFSCVPSQEVKKDASEMAVSGDELPRTVAVLPFQNDTPERGIANQMRRAFANHFSAKNYNDMKLPVVDEKVVLLEKSAGKSVLDLKPQEICQALQCDGLVYGKVTDYKKVYAGLYSQLGLEAEIWMVNTKTGKEIFRIKDAVRYHEGGVPLSPLGLIMTAVSTAMNVRDIQQVRLLNELSYKFNGKIPSPPRIAAEERPVIKDVLTNAKEGPFGKGKIIRVGLEGDSGMVATFDIGSFKRGVPMKETKPGIYLGEYLVLPGDNTTDMPLVASLSKPGGYESQWIDAGGFIMIDTTPPPQVKGVKVKGFHDRIELAWDAISNIPDLKGYIVARSTQPLSGFSELGRVELNSFEDRTAQPGTIYYYHVTAIDTTGNESDITDAVRAALMQKEPVVLTGELGRDTVLSGQYIVRGNLVVPKGISLSADPETSVLFEENAALIVYGKLAVNGKGAPVEFLPSGNVVWKGVTVENGMLAMDGFRIKGAVTALTARPAEGTVEGGLMADSGTGMSLSGVSTLVVRGCTISGNKAGMELVKSNARIEQSAVFQNVDGIVMKGFSGEIRDNNIFDNTRNIVSESPVKIEANYLGSVQVEEMRTSGILAARVYDAKVPGGKVVDAVANPYTSLNEEERRKKSAEFVIEAGAYFRQSNYGKAATLFEEALKASPSAEAYYYLALCYRQMKEDDKALKYLQEGAGKFPKDSTLVKNLGLLYYEKNNEAEAKKAFEEVLRLSPEDRQVKFMLERLGK